MEKERMERVEQILADYSGARLGHCREPRDEGIMYLLADLYEYCQNSPDLDFHHLFRTAAHLCTITRPQRKR